VRTRSPRKWRASSPPEVDRSNIAYHPFPGVIAPPRAAAWTRRVNEVLDLRSPVGDTAPPEVSLSYRNYSRRPPFPFDAEPMERVFTTCLERRPGIAPGGAVYDQDPASDV